MKKKLFFKLIFVFLKKGFVETLYFFLIFFQLKLYLDVFIFVISFNLGLRSFKKVSSLYT